MPSWAGDPLEIIPGAVKSIKALCLVIGLLRSRKGKHVLHGGDNRVRPRRSKLHPIREIESFGRESRKGLLGVLRSLGGEQFLERSDEAGRRRYTDPGIERGKVRRNRPSAGATKG